MAANEKSMPYYYDTVFRNVFDAVTEINLCTGRYQHTIFSKETYGLSASGNYATDFDGKAFSFVISDDREKVQKAFSFPKLSKACVQGPSSKVCQYRIQTEDGRQKWMESRAYFVRGEAQLFVIITSKNISDIKINEHRMRIADEYDRALRDIYDEFYELNLMQDSCRVVYHTKNKFVLPVLEGTLGEVVAHVAEHNICPEDKERFLAFFNLEAMKSQFAAGRESILGEFRRQWADGTFRWASYTVFPVQKAAESDEILLCFIMDIDEKKRADELLEQNRLLQKQRQLDERFRIIVQQTGTQVFEWDVETGLQYLSEDLPKMLAGNYDGRDLYTLWLADRVVHPDDADRILQCQANLFGGKSHCDMKIRLKNPKGAYLWFKIWCHGCA